MNRQLALVNIVGLLLGVSYGMHNPILPVFARDVLGASYAELGAIGFASYAPYVFVPVLVGALLVRYNSGIMLSAGVALSAASTYLLSIAHTVPEVMAYRVLSGISHALFWPPCEAIISAASPGGQRVKNIARFTAFFVAGFTAGPLAGALLLNDAESGYRLAFAAAALAAAAGLVASVPAARGTARRAGAISFGAIRSMAAFPEVIIILLYCTAAFGTILLVYPAYLSEQGVKDWHIELLFFAFGASRLATLALAGRLASCRRPVVAAAAGSVAAAMLAIWHGGEAYHAVGLVLIGFGTNIFFPLGLEAVLSRTRPEDAGAMIGAYEAVFGIGWVIGPVFAGLVSHFYGSSSPYMALFVAGAAAAGLAIVRRRRLVPALA